MTAKPSTGTLGQTPLCQLLIFLLDRSLSGSLVVQHSIGGRSSVTVERGIPVKVRAGNTQLGFGELCVALGLTTEARLEEFLETDKRRPIGEAMVDRGLIPAEEVGRVLEEQVLARLEWIAAEPDETIFGFYQDQDYLSGWGGEARRVDPLRAIGRVARRKGLAQARVAELLKGWEDNPIRLHRLAQVPRFGFERDVSSALDMLRAKPMAFAELRRLKLASDESLGQALALLALCRHLDVGGAPLGIAPDAEASAQPVEVRKRVATGTGLRPRLGSQADAETPPESVKVQTSAHHQVQALSAELAERLLASDSKSHYEMLGVDVTADAATIQSAFLALAKRWHPDRLPAAARSLRGDVTKLFSRFAEAHQVLSNPAQRAEYDRVSSEIHGSPEEQEDVQRVLRAANLFQKADALAKRSDWAQVERLAKQAHELDATQPEYGALYAFAITKSGQRAASNNYEDLLAILNAAAKAQRNNPRIRLYRASVLKAAGLGAEALKDFRAVVELEPNNVEAAREIRLHKMRAEQTSNPDGLLKRLFKK